MKKIITLVLCIVMVMSLAACRNNDATDSTINTSTPTEPIDGPIIPEVQPLDEANADIDDWSEHLSKSEKRMQDIVITYEASKEGEPLAEFVKNDKGEEGWFIKRHSGRLYNTTTKVEEIPSDDMMIMRLFKDENGKEYALSSMTVPDEEHPDLYFYLVEKNLFIRGMAFMAEYYGNLVPKPETPVMENFMYIKDTGEIVVKLDVSKDINAKGVVIRMFDEDYNIICNDEHESTSGTFTMSVAAPKDKLTLVGFVSYNVGENGEVSESNLSELQIVPNEAYAKYMEEYHKEMEENKNNAVVTEPNDTKETVPETEPSQQTQENS